MPKMKTHSGMKKKIKVTGSGKLLRRKKPRLRHFHESKPSTRKRQLDITTEVAPANRKQVRRLLGK